MVDLVSSESGGEVVSGFKPSINKAEDQAAAHDPINPSHRANDHSDDENDITLDYELALLSLSPIRFDGPQPNLSVLVTTLANYNGSCSMLQIFSVLNPTPPSKSEQMASGGRGQGQAIKVEADDPVVSRAERARPLTEFSTDYFFYTMTDKLLLSLHSRYEILDDIHLLSIGENDLLSQLPAGYITLYLGYLEAGLKLPLHFFLYDFFSNSHIYLIRLNLNRWWVLIALWAMFRLQGWPNITLCILKYLY
ncbi:hypothetical protein PanWU01x14_307180 [Parasponia andersonii]|uniref:Uncharacterized protein n=1 Tax=Parasponia andersonii TaxID=3476 RepID=A0A2P5ARG4_PARAD|nr:hypothetical protein PanWU01x14_307180 [Parasponia andersonii]